MRTSTVGLFAAFVTTWLVSASAVETQTKVPGPARAEGGLLSWPENRKLNDMRLTLPGDADQKPTRGQATTSQAQQARFHAPLESSGLRPALAIPEGDGKRSYLLVGGSLVGVFVTATVVGSALRRRWRKKRRLSPGARRFTEVP
ncbi:uncharacterized protein LOC125941578 [Dermacentor silvarum]|uniref:uncharacterized protein LOC125941578 n=1 Tax=Dermacentor silvarum TaxID=543639 RepID=UPI002100FC56|nr:uncharacterized protein LOC125941578 [Dermacentor silvarum]